MNMAGLQALSPERRRELAALASRLPPAFIDRNFPAQTRFLEDDYRFQLLFGTRRSGKSNAVGRKLFRTACVRPKGVTLYLGLTREEAKRIMWKPVLHPLNDALGLRGKPNETELSWTFPNGSVTYLVGADANEQQKRKIYGQKFDGVAIDEAALWRVDLRTLIHSTILPALADRNGWLVVSGMAGSHASRGYFWAHKDDEGNVYPLTKDQDARQPGTWEAFDGRIKYRGHRWSAWENPYMRDVWEKDVADAIKANPDIVNDPSFIEDYLGRWAPEAPNRVYRYLPSKNDVADLPNSNEWTRYLGIDPGFVDDTAYVVGWWRRGDPVLYIVHAEKHPGQDIHQVAARIREIQTDRRYGPFDRMIVDGANKQAVETIRRHFSLGLTPAEKTNKWEHIVILNSDLGAGWIKLLPAAAALKKEWTELERDRSSDKPREKDGQPNHCSDAALYVHHEAVKFLREPAKPPPAPAYGTNEWAEADKERRFAEIRAENARQRWGFPQ